MAWLSSYRRLALRYDRSEETIIALLALACHRRLTQPLRFCNDLLAFRSWAAGEPT